MKLTHPAVVAFGLAMLPMLPILSGIVEPKHDILYHFDGPTYIVFFPVLISITLLWILFTAILMLARKPGKARLILWSAIMFILALGAPEDLCHPSRVGHTKSPQSAGLPGRHRRHRNLRGMLETVVPARIRPRAGIHRYVARLQRLQRSADYRPPLLERLAQVWALRQ